MATFTSIFALLFFTLASTTTAEELPVKNLDMENGKKDQSTVDPQQPPGYKIPDEEHEIDGPRRHMKHEFGKMPKAAGIDPFLKNPILQTADDDIHRYAKKLSATSVQMSALYDSMNSQMKTYKDSLIVLVHAAKELMRNMRKTLNEEANAVDLENHARMLPIDSLDDLVLHHVQNYAWKKKGDYQHESIDAVEQATKTMHDQTTKTSQDNMMKHKNDQIVQAAKATEFATTLQKKQKDDLSMEHAGDKLTAEELANQVKALLKHETEHRLTIAVKADKDAEYEKQRAAYLETVITQGTDRLTEKKKGHAQDLEVRKATAEVLKATDVITTDGNDLHVAEAAVSRAQAQINTHTSIETVGKELHAATQSEGESTHAKFSANMKAHWEDELKKEQEKVTLATTKKAEGEAAKQKAEEEEQAEKTKQTELQATHAEAETERAKQLETAEANLKASKATDLGT